VPNKRGSIYVCLKLNELFKKLLVSLTCCKNVLKQEGRMCDITLRVFLSDGGGEFNCDIL
jgi:hypothetical protein